MLALTNSQVVPLILGILSLAMAISPEPSVALNMMLLIVTLDAPLGLVILPLIDKLLSSAILIPSDDTSVELLDHTALVVKAAAVKLQELVSLIPA